MKKHNHDGYEHKDEGDDLPGVAEVKAALKAANDAQHKEWDALQKKLEAEQKKSDGVLKDEIKKLHETMAATSEEQKAENAKLHAVINRLNQSGTKASADTVKEARTKVALNALRNYAQKGTTTLSDDEAKSFAGDYGIAREDLPSGSRGVARGFHYAVVGIDSHKEQAFPIQVAESKKKS